MSERLPPMGPLDIGALSPEAMHALVTGRRWFAESAEPVTSVTPVVAATLRTSDPALALVIAEVRFANGQHDLYQLLLGEGSDEPDGVRLTDGLRVRDALDHPEVPLALVGLTIRDAEVAAGDGFVRFHPVPGNAPRPAIKARPLGRDHSNSGVVADERLFIKVYRRLLAGPSPELELLRHLGDQDFAHVPALAGWWAYEGSRIETTLGILQDFLPDATDGFDAARASAGSGSTDPRFVESLGRLGTVTAALHLALADDRNDASFAREELGPETISLMAATLDERRSGFMLEPSDTDLAMTVEALRSRLRGINHPRLPGWAIRIHGDFHLGQALLQGSEWFLVDFEGEPLREPGERRRKRSPLRDVAGLLRSIDYAAATASVIDGAPVHPDWAAQGREGFRSAYLLGMSGAEILPAGTGVVDELIFLFEVEKVLYELDYERAHRPGWVEIPLRGLRALAA